MLPDNTNIATKYGASRPQVSIEIDKWQLAKDKDGQIEHPVRITQRDGDSEVEESPADLSTDTAESADERNESNEAGDGSAEKKKIMQRTGDVKNWKLKKDDNGDVMFPLRVLPWKENEDAVI